MYTCMLTRKFLQIRCSEIASEAILGQRQSRSSYLHGLKSIAFNFWLSMYAKPADFEVSTREGTKIGRIVGGVASLEGQLVNSRAHEIAIYAHKLFMVFFHRSGIKSLCARTLSNPPPCLWS